MNERAGTPVRDQDLIDVDVLISVYYDIEPDPVDPLQAVVFGTSGHRGSNFDGAFNEAHIAATMQAIVEYREAQGYDGPPFTGRDTHGLSAPAERTVIEVFAASDADVRVDSRGPWTSTPSVSPAILRANGTGTIANVCQAESGPADGTVITPSHNPLRDGGFKYNPPTDGPADTDATKVITARVNEPLREDWKNIARVPYERAKGSVCGYEHLNQYTDALVAMIDFAAIHKAGVRIGVDPMGGASAEYWGAVGERYGLDLIMVNSVVDPKWSFMTLDWDGEIRMDCSFSNVMAPLRAGTTPGLDGKMPFDVVTGNDTDPNRHGIATLGGDLMNPSHYLVVAIEYPFVHRSGWREGTAVGKTLVPGSLIDRVAAGTGKKPIGVPVGFKWFVPGLLTGDVGLGEEESVGGSFLHADGMVWMMDKDGLTTDLPTSEIIAATGKSPSQLHAEQAECYGDPAYACADAPATKTQKTRLAALSPEDVVAPELVGEPTTAKLVRTPGSDAPTGGLRVMTESSWFATRLLRTEDMYKIYAESFKGVEHLTEVQEAAKAAVSATLDA